MKLAVASIEEAQELMSFMQFMDECYSCDWETIKEDWAGDEKYDKIIKHCTDEFGEFNSDYFFDYYRINITHKYMRVIFGYITLYENCCDQTLDHHDFNTDIKKGLELLEESQKKEIDIINQYFNAPTNREVGLELKFRRLELDLHIGDIANELNVSPPTITRLERGQGLTKERVKKIDIYYSKLENKD